jgi:hypothetical protein
MKKSMLLRWTMAAREGDSGEDRSSGDADENPKVGWDVPPEEPHAGGSEDLLLAAALIA